MINSAINGPSLAAALAFTMIEPIEMVARVHRAAARRLAATNPWRAFRALAVDVTDEPDDLVRIRIYAECISKPESTTQVFEFLVGIDPSKRSQRFDAFLKACGIKDMGEGIEGTHEIEGRYFAVRNRGRSPMDFGTISDWLDPAYRAAA